MTYSDTSYDYRIVPKKEDDRFDRFMVEMKSGHKGEEDWESAFMIGGIEALITRLAEMGRRELQYMTFASDQIKAEIKVLDRQEEERKKVAQDQEEARRVKAAADYELRQSLLALGKTVKTKKEKMVIEGREYTVYSFGGLFYYKHRSDLWRVCHRESQKSVTNGIVEMATARGILAAFLSIADWNESPLDVSKVYSQLKDKLTQLREAGITGNK